VDKRKERLLKKAIASPNNLRFDEFVKLIEAFGYEFDRMEGSHQLFRHAELTQKMNIQDEKGKAKPYQVRQFLKLVEKYDLKIKD
jgi:predicted RNA binding protein YcfA (HicA-like mRNA interferase family)